MRYDVISRKTFIDGKEMTDRHFNTLLLECRAREPAPPIARGSAMVPGRSSPLIADAQPIGAKVSHLPNPASPQELWRICFRKWFVAMVAGWLNPKVVNHQMIVLIGKQGIYKSTWLDALIPPQLERYRCRQSTTDFGSKDEQLPAPSSDSSTSTSSTVSMTHPSTCSSRSSPSASST